jgi:hypothetical protein
MVVAFFRLFFAGPPQGHDDLANVVAGMRTAPSIASSDDHGVADMTRNARELLGSASRIATNCSRSRIAIAWCLQWLVKTSFTEVNDLRYAKDQHSRGWGT